MEMDKTEEALHELELGIKALFLVWGFPRGTRRSQFIAQEMGMEVKHVYLTSRQSAIYALLKYPVQAMKTLMVLARRRPQVVFVQNPPIFGALMVYLWGVIAGAKYVIDSHTDALLSSWWAWSLPLHRFLSRRAITTIVTNEYLRQMVADWGADAFILTDLPMALPERREVHGKPLAYLDDASFNIVIVSTASYDEPIAEILDAANSLQNAGVSFHITGDYQTKAPHVIQSAPANLHFTGYVPNGEFYGLLEAAGAVMCLTTENHTMQSGASEALWSGKPIITSDWPLLRKYFNKGTLHVDNTAEGIRRAVVTMRDHLPTFEDEIRTLQEERWREWQHKGGALAGLVRQSLALPPSAPPASREKAPVSLTSGGEAPRSASPSRPGRKGPLRYPLQRKVLVVLGDGGHTAEMLRLLKLLGPKYEYSYMMATNDFISEGKIAWQGPVYRVPVPLGKYASQRKPVRALVAIFKQLIVLLQARPKAILSTGANIAVPISFFGRLLGAKVIHIETGSRIYTMSSTGKLMYRIAHLFFVQWESLQEKYPKAIYAGRLL
jgi:glycosyltransferase involved in cell wall biosynthesis